MPNPPSPEPLERVTFNASAADMKALKQMYGHGVSEVIRRLIRQHVNKIKEQVHD